MFREPVVLGKSGLRVGRIGLGSGYDGPAAAFEEAFERGLNYFYWGTSRSAGMREAIRRLAPRHREELVIVVQSYTNAGIALAPSVRFALSQLGLDYADVLLLGLWNRRVSDGVMNEAMKLKERGLVRRLAVSAHERKAFAIHLQDPRFDIIHVRYNAVHRGAEKDVFPLLPPAAAQERPGVVTYTTTRWGHLVDPARTPAGERTPRGRDCYRFALSHPKVDAATAGPRTVEELREALAALDEGPLTDDERAWMCRVGDALHHLPPAEDIVKRIVRSL